MSENRSPFTFTRRRFAFWVGLGLFSLGEKFGVGGFDSLAAAAMRATEPAEAIDETRTPEHWTAAENNNWRWFERENLVNGQWVLTGITLPVNKQTGEPHPVKTGYLDESLVPEAVRLGKVVEDGAVAEKVNFEADHGRPSPSRRARHGRPPSRWLRSLTAEELRIWLPKIDVPEAGVSGMTYWTHLTRDHSFDPKKIDGLTEPEQAKLHAAAHYGY
jgi:hypothetical protein